MKQNYIEVQVKIQILQSIRDAFNGSNQTILNEKIIRSAVQNHPFRQLAEKVGSLAFCKGPPGQARSPGVASHLFPEHPPDHCPANENHLKTNLKPIYSPLNIRQCAEIHLNTEYQIVIKTQLLQPFKFFIMKKQILFLAFLVLAVVAGNLTAFGQLSPGVTNPANTTPQPLPPLSCAANANFLHPIAGQSYNYSMDGVTGVEDVSLWTWFATKDPAFITAGSLNTGAMLTSPGALLATGTNYGAPGATNSVDITWSSTILTNTLYQGAPSTTVFPSPTFVVGYGTGVACADNIKVYEINPIINFTVDIASIDPATNTTLGWDVPTAQCVDKVQGATYDGATDALVMNYGTNTLYFEVAAANFNTDFTPTFTLISGLNTVQTAVVTLHSSLALAQAGTLVVPGATTNWTATSTTWATGLQFTATNPADVAAGVSLFVKVVITNSTEESLTVNPFILAVDARDKTNTGIWDMEDADCTVLVDDADQIDQATHTVNPRPTITGVDDTATNPAAPNNIVPKLP